MSEAHKEYTRFTLAQRIEHFVLILSFTTLGLTGLPQKYPLSPVSQTIINGLGGIEAVRIIHRIAATVFLVEAIYHLVVLGYKLFVLGLGPSMLPTLKDAQDAIQSFGYNLGLVKEAPKMPRYNFTEKAEYWAMLWGLAIMALTGFMLWNPIATTNILPGDFIPAAKTAHGGEAVLAVLAIILWHFYHVHLRRFNRSMFTGKVDREEMIEDHGQELAEIESGRRANPPAPAVVRRRMAIFAPAATLFSLVFLVVVYYFMTFEKSAITTIPPAEQVQVYAPQTPTPVPPTPVPPTPVLPTATSASQTGSSSAAGSNNAVAFTGGIDGLLEQKCVSCHGSVGGFNAESYDAVLKAVQPGDPEASQIVQAQKAGNHPGQLAPDELDRLITWIQAGAPQQAGAAGENPDTWNGGIGEVFSAKCGSCHGSLGGFTATTYEDALKQIQPGDPDGSKVVEVQKSGSHPGKFTDEELARVITWIQAGAPQQ